MRTLVLIFTILFSHCAFAGSGWWARTCARLIDSRPAAPTPQMLRVETELRGEISRSERYSSHHFALEHGTLDFLAQKPMGIQIFPRFGSQVLQVRPIDMRLFVNPGAIDLQWDDSARGLADGPALAVLFDDVPVKTAGGESSLRKIFENEFAAILETNKEMAATQHFASTREFHDLTFRREYRGYQVMWIEGKISNFQVKRALLLSLEVALEQVASDPRYATKKPEPPPTRH